MEVALKAEHGAELRGQMWDRCVTHAAVGQMCDTQLWDSSHTQSQPSQGPQSKGAALSQEGVWGHSLTAKSAVKALGRRQSRAG